MERLEKKMALFYRSRITVVALLLVLVGIVSSISSVQASELTVKTARSFVKFIAAGGKHSLALKSDGEMQYSLMNSYRCAYDTFLRNIFKIFFIFVTGIPTFLIFKIVIESLVLHK